MAIRRHRSGHLRWPQLILGLALFGIAASLMLRSDLGLGPWDVFHAGLSHLTGLSFGLIVILVGAVIVTAMIIIGIRPGAGTVVNMVLVGVFIDVFLPLFPNAPGWMWGLVYYTVAIVIGGFATGLYIGAGLGPGPRDGLMIGISKRSGRAVGRVRTAIEFSVLLVGFLMGGKIGIGTLIYAATIGPATQWGLTLFGAAPETRAGSRGRLRRVGRLRAWRRAA